MTIQVEFWTLVGFLISFIGAICGLARWLFSNAEARQAARFMSLEQTMKETATRWSTLEREFLEFRAQLPVDYVRREDYIRGQTVIEAKLDAVYEKLDNVQNRQNLRG
ncbi:hypothetical protein QG78_001961 [Salmonella enterica subsp. enterica]|uniref:hypothetical protein n=1 Tax=Salmonella enterica TaxID=28901 RepID=UPI0009AF2A9F|nr:hypothetical protein [Salmonella enterica]EAA7373022.1 hypothetical protein [Salmonella enterica subsp. enterica serovar Mikawasima]EBS4563072.1 hypothetical protein [Salmonella enterica subsp. enterica serovar Bovismorbificans]EBZ4590204.1 hypothetical protein [Salmonella enterica subsp. enterica serovar Hato]ECI5744505.1 hypothetical protein [Salmonella enterica subsp. enterica]ECM1813083.1 hypothetical protein [Salmonella enterica subsp. enterica serovar Newport]ECV5893735.1 hypothetica